MTSKSKKKTTTGSAIKVAAVFLTISLASSLLIGCESAGSSSALSLAVSDYNAQHYLSAQKRSTIVAKNSKGKLRDQATYLSGLSSYKLGDLIDAELQLTKAANSPDQTTAGRAKAVLGLIRVDQDRPGDAADLLSQASISMKGEDSRQAAYQAALAHDEAGSGVSGYVNNSHIYSSRSSQGWSNSSDPSRRKAFSLQAGAFRDRKRAEAAAEKIASVAQANGLGTVRIVKSNDDRGRTLFFVQIGSFNSRFHANDIHRQIGRKDLIVAPRAEPTL